MGLTPKQNKALFNTYQARRARNEALQKKRREEAYEQVPKLKELDRLIADKGLEFSKLIQLSPEKRLNFIALLTEEMNAFKKEKQRLLTENNFPSDYLDKIYTCALCEDTGMIDGEQCTCLKNAYINMAYKESNLLNIVDSENFDTFSFDFYSRDIDKKYGISPYENIQSIYAICKGFVENFDMQFSNLILYGQSGLGKTFLCNCIAKDLLDTSHSVIYLSSFQLFKLFENYRFNKAENIVSYNDIEHLYSSDLLIIDDLGSEIINSFTSSELFNLINTRLLSKKSTVISSNLTPPEWSKYYSNRIVSRIMGNYKHLRLIGADIRMLNSHRMYV